MTTNAKLKKLCLRMEWAILPCLILLPLIDIFVITFGEYPAYRDLTRLDLAGKILLNDLLICYILLMMYFFFRDIRKYKLFTLQQSKYLLMCSLGCFSLSLFTILSNIQIFHNCFDIDFQSWILLPLYAGLAGLLLSRYVKNASR
ncbi:hypothetical protein CIG19_02135 [Enterobacterales bacterium CwR94]|nr:hypothetical protein CIG19_02135 [Enterobacterales bacterium CwR94]